MKTNIYQTILQKKTQKSNLRTDFLLFSMLSMVILVLLMFFQIKNITFYLQDMNKETLEKINYSNIATIAALLEDENIIHKDTKSIKNIADKFTSYSLLNKLIIINKQKNIVLYSNVWELPTNTIDEMVINNFIDKNARTHVFSKKTSIDGVYEIYFCTNIEDKQQEALSTIYMDSRYILVIALATSFLLSWLISSIILKPVSNLLVGTKQFAHGNFSYRLPESKYNEINKLVFSYNQMAENLQSLYKSLEKKVKDRTSELEKTLKELKSTQAMMVHSEKMKSLGGLVAGITHEINNPINFIYGNLIHLQNYSNDLITIIEKYRTYDQNLLPEQKQEIAELLKEIDYEFLKEDLPALLKSCQDGTERTKNIIIDLKNFSRLDENVVSNVDLKKEIDTTLNILTNKLKNRITIHKEYAENMPLVEAHGGQINQVLMNILDNASYAIKDKGDIYIRLNYDDKYALIEIEDTGCGMDEETAKKVFDPFYTTKPVGQGTGLGMSISYKVIKNHSGDIELTSELKKGSKFKIKLPLSFTPSEKEINV